MDNAKGITDSRGSGKDTRGLPGDHGRFTACRPMPAEREREFPPAPGMVHRRRRIGEIPWATGPAKSVVHTPE